MKRAHDAATDNLTPSQAAARRFFADTAGNALILGQPGTGKSYLLKALQEDCDRRRLKHATLAWSGAAAHAVRGFTLHSRLVPLPHGRPVCKTADEMRDCLWRALRGSLGGNVANAKVAARAEFWATLDVLFIDEIFLVDAGMFALADLTARRLRGNDEPFGGVRLVVMGDPNQMAPQKDALHPFRPVPLGDPPQQDDDDDEEPALPPVAVRTELHPWAEAAFTPFTLRENKRQEAADQAVFRTTLEMMCTRPAREMPAQQLDLLRSMCVTAIPDGAYALFWSREDAERRNAACNDATGGAVLAELSLGIEYGGPSGAVRELESAVREFVAALPFEGRDTVLREGGLLMLLTNLDVAGGAYRGATGTVSSIVRDGTKVTGVCLTLDSQPPGAEPVLVVPMVETIAKGDFTCKISYWPIGYGYAGTYISAQGKTINKIALAVTPSMPPGTLLFINYNAALQYPCQPLFEAETYIATWTCSSKMNIFHRIGDFCSLLYVVRSGHGVRRRHPRAPVGGRLLLRERQPLQPQPHGCLQNSHGPLHYACGPLGLALRGDHPTCTGV